MKGHTLKLVRARCVAVLLLTALAACQSMTPAQQEAYEFRRQCERHPTSVECTNAMSPGGGN